MAYDVVIKNGTVVDGTGHASRIVLMSLSKVIALPKLARSRIPRNARSTLRDILSLLVLSIFIPTSMRKSFGTRSLLHRAGMASRQLSWATVVSPSRRVSRQDREYLAHLMESVEDIPAASIMAGMPWQWETYGEYLKALDSVPKGMNVGGMVGHCAVRYWAMGARKL